MGNTVTNGEVIDGRDAKWWSARLSGDVVFFNEVLVDKVKG